MYPSMFIVGQYLPHFATSTRAILGAFPLRDITDLTLLLLLGPPFKRTNHLCHMISKFHWLKPPCLIAKSRSFTMFGR